METNHPRIFRSVVAALALFLTASGAHAVVYKWVEEDGNVIYSNEPPADQSKVRELTRVDDLSLVPSERGTPELRAEEKEKPSASSEVASPAPTTAKREPAVTLIPQEPVTLLPKNEPASPRESAERPARVIPRSTHSAAVQDPCLVSPDPRCYERNKANYHPARGYQPPDSSHAVGASGSAAAGGAVGGQVSAPQGGAQALPPGRAPSSIAIEWSRR